MNERLHLKTSGEQLGDFYENQDPLDAAHTVGLGIISTVALVDKINARLDQSAIVTAASEKSERTALEKLRIAQGRRPGDSVSVVVPETGKEGVHNVRPPVEIERKKS